MASRFHAHASRLAAQCERCGLRRHSDRLAGKNRQDHLHDQDQDRKRNHPMGWDPRDAFPPTLEITGTTCIFGSPPTFAAGWHFSPDTVRASPDLVDEFKLRRKEEWGKGMGETWMEQ